MPSGSYGKVLFSEKTAYKFLFKQDKNIYGSSSLKEIDFLKRCDHPNIIKIDEIIISKNTSEYDKLGIGMSKADCNLYEYFKKNTIDKFQFREIVYQTLLSLLYIHSKKICHRDIKPDNFLMFKNTVKLSDFGLSVNLLLEWNKFELSCIKRYRAPEIYCKKDYNFGIDIWALGCIIYELYNDTCLFRGNTSADILNIIINKAGITKQGAEVLGIKYNPVNFKLKMDNQHLLGLIKGMLDTNPKTRFNALDCLHSHYFVSLGTGYFYDILQIFNPHNVKQSDIFLVEDIRSKFTKQEITLAFDIYIRFNRPNLSDKRALMYRNVCLYISHKILSKDIKPYEELFDDKSLSSKSYESIEMKILDELDYNVFRFTICDFFLPDDYDLHTGIITMENIEYDMTLKDLRDLYIKAFKKVSEIEEQEEILSPISNVSEIQSE